MYSEKKSERNLVALIGSISDIKKNNGKFQAQLAEQES